MADTEHAIIAAGAAARLAARALSERGWPIAPPTVEFIRIPGREGEHRLRVTVEVVPEEQ